MKVNDIVSIKATFYCIQCGKKQEMFIYFIGYLNIWFYSFLFSILFHCPEFGSHYTESLVKSLLLFPLFLEFSIRRIFHVNCLFYAVVLMCLHVTRPTGDFINTVVTVADVTAVLQNID